MKAYFLFISAISIASQTFAQDTVFKTNGEQISAKVTEVSSSEIRYKLENDSLGPVYVLSLSDVYMVEYANGRKEVFASKSIIKNDSLSESVSKDRELIESKYKNKLGGGIAGVVIGSAAIIVSTPFFIVELNRLKGEDVKSVGKAVGAGFGMFVGVVSFAAGIDALVKASVLKEQLRNMPIAINPTVIQGTAYSGSLTHKSTMIGVSVSYKF